MTNRYSHVFISYCHDNFAEVIRLREDLLKAGESVWWDRDIKPGQDWKFAVRQAIKQSYAVVLCLSEETQRRKVSGIYLEALDAISAYRAYSPGSIFLIPVRLSDCEIPPLEIDATRTLDCLQYVDLFPASKREVGLAQLIDAVRLSPHHPLTALSTHSRADSCRLPGDADAYSAPSSSGWSESAADLEPDDSDPLPFVLDRTMQVERLREEMLKHRLSKPQRPFLCVIHGNQVEDHESFFTRLKKDLPEILASWYPERARQAPVETYKMTLSLTKITDDNWSDVFWGDLTRALFNSRQASREDVLRFIARTKLALMIYVPLPSKQLAGVTIDRLNRFFEFWSTGWRLSERLFLFVCLSFQYQQQYDARRRFWLWKRQGLNDKLRRYVTDLDFSAYQDLHGVCLPELRAISQEDAEAAASDVHVRARYDFTERDVIWLYNNGGLCNSEGCIPMLKVIFEFEKKKRSVR
jgi:hypothetical protein